jgi:hypothetical protein
MSSARSTVVVCALIACARLASAQPAPTTPPVPDPDHHASLAKPAAAAIVTALYAGYATWSYFAWYRDADSSAFHHEDSTGFRLQSYAGGADKLGHFWATYALARATTELLSAGGWNHRASSLWGSGLAGITFLLTELEDGFTVGFDNEDMIANTAGAAFALLLSNSPTLDRLLDFRLEYVPSPPYRRDVRTRSSLDVAQDYTGQSYMLALHLDAVPRVASTKWTRWTRYVDVVLGFETRNFSPAPFDLADLPRQRLYGGFAINMQRVLSSLFCDCTGRRIATGIFEVASLPYTTLPVVDAERTREPASP